MKTTFEIPYQRYALISEVAKRARSPGRTAIQKYLYLLQSVYGSEPLYEFSMYTYGPFSSQVLSDLDVAEAMGAVQVVRTNYGYSISPGPEADRMTGLSRSFLEPLQNNLDKLFMDFGKFSAKDLELRSTIIYASQDLERTGGSQGDLADTVHEIKPGFSRTQIDAAIAELSKLGYVHLPQIAETTSQSEESRAA
jgi:uncharacterized protein